MAQYKLDAYIERHQKTLSEVIQQAAIPSLRLKEAMLYALFPGGKRIRPLLVYCSGELLKLPLECLDIIAAAVELTHCYSLVHDDLPAMDNDDFRRGKPSCHKAFDEATAILVGDALQAFAIELLIEKLPLYLSDTQVLAVVSTLLKASGPSGMVSGQSLDLSELNQAQVPESLLTKIHQLKTGQIIHACTQMVIAASLANNELKQALSGFSMHLGLVFQMQDDFLDLYGAPKAIGKNRSSDAANQKHTFANLYSESALRDLIGNHFQMTKQALSPFGEQASSLLLLIELLEQRGGSHVKSTQSSC